MQKQTKGGIPILSSLLSKFRNIRTKYSLYLQQKNPVLETKSGRRLTRRDYLKTIKRVWNSIYERGKMEGILQSTTRGRETKTILQGKRENEEGSDKRVSDEQERRRIIKAMASMFEGEAFSHFIEILQEKENSDLSELVEPLMKSDKLSNNEYSFLLRGRLEVYQAIRDEIKRIISLAKSYAVSD